MSAELIDEKAVFNLARQIDSPAARADYLQQVCDADPAALQRVQDLLQVHEQEQSFLESPAVAVNVTIDQPPAEKLGTIIGPYKLLQQIGEGGMGVVYMAEQTDPVQRRVALKIIKPGMDTRQVIARFEAERQALAMMDHPNIAKVFEAGTTESRRPYFVMELVRGIPMTRYCDEKHLSLKERLELIIPVCQAIQHAHQKGIIHRDIKPTNVLVAQYDGRPVPKVIDFGVAKATAQKLTEQTMFTELGQVVGTAEYMSPEQAELNQLDIDTRSDIYSLGVLLYELLTGTTPFDKHKLRSAAFHEMLRIIREDEPSKPSTSLSTSGMLASISANRQSDPVRLCKAVRGELDWIVMKALAKERNRRYETAKDFAADVQRYLNDEPVQACPPSWWYRVCKSTRRYKAQLVTAGVVLSLVVLLVGVVVGGLWDRSVREQKVARERIAQEAAAKLKIAEVTAAEAEKREREIKRELVLQNAREIQVTKHAEGWRAKIAALLERAVEVRKDLRVRSQVIASLPGLDARLEKPIASFGGSAIAFERSRGPRLLVGGLAAEPAGPEGQPARLWDHETNGVASVSSLMQTGPVAFRANGTPVQLVVNPKNARQLLLWDVARNQASKEFDFPLGQNEAHPELSSIAMSDDATHVAASGRGPDGKGLLAVWRTQTGELVQKLPVAATALTFSPDLTLLAAGDEEGVIAVYSLPKGELITPLSSDRTSITCLAMQRDRRVSAEPKAQPAVKNDARWLIAAGDASGTVNIWDLQNRAVRSRCLSSSYHVHAVEFSPDGMTLASAGRGQVKLWDIGTGQHLLDLDAGNWITDVTYSADGIWIAASMKAAFGDPAEIRIWKLEPGRGVLALRGLTSVVEKVWISPDEQLVAALSHECRVAVWNRKTGQLLHVFEPPVALWVDNCSGAFSPDSKRFAFSGSDGHRGSCQLWDLESGEEVGSWSLPPGLNHILAFHPSGKLLHFQVEERAGKRLLDSSMKAQEHPRVGRIRDLVVDPNKPILEITEFNRHIDFPVAPADGRFIALVGYYGEQELRGRRIVVLDTFTGKEIWASEPEIDPSRIRSEKVGLTLDRSGKALGIMRGVSGSGKAPKSALIELPSGRALIAPPEIASFFTHWHREMPYWVNAAHPQHQGQLSLIRSGEVDPVAILDMDRQPTGSDRPYSANGNLAAWGNSDGTVHVIDFPQVLAELKKLHLEW